MGVKESPMRTMPDALPDSAATPTGELAVDTANRVAGGIPDPQPHALRSRFRVPLGALLT